MYRIHSGPTTNPQSSAPSSRSSSRCVFPTGRPSIYAAAVAAAAAAAAAAASNLMICGFRSLQEIRKSGKKKRRKCNRKSDPEIPVTSWLESNQGASSNLRNARLSANDLGKPATAKREDPLFVAVSVRTETEMEYVRLSCLEPTQPAPDDPTARMNSLRKGLDSNMWRWSFSASSDYPLSCAADEMGLRCVLLEEGGAMAFI